MAAITSYSTLKTEVESYAERSNDATYVAQIDLFIDLAEAHFNRTLKCQQMEEEATVTTDSNGIAALPSDFLAPRIMYRDADPETPIKFTTTKTLRELNPYLVSGFPEWAAVTGGNVHVSPIYEGNFTLQYFEKIPALDGTTTTNWLLDLAPDAYLFMCLAQGEIFLQNAEGAAGFKSLANEVLHDLGLLDELSRTSNSQMLIQGCTP